VSNDPYSAVMRKEPRSPMLVALAIAILLAGSVLFMWSRGWLRVDSTSAAEKGAQAPAAEAVATCERAADRYISCIGEMLGPGAKELAARKRDIQSCARDSKTVVMYEQCLPKTDCQSFLDCMTDYASNTAP
jgi:hypothetical protein